MDHPIPARKPDWVLINKKKRTCHLKNFAISIEHRLKTKNRQIFGFQQRTEKLQKMRMMVIPIVVGALGTISKGYWRKNQDHPHNSTIKIS